MKTCELLLKLKSREQTSGCVHDLYCVLVLIQKIKAGQSPYCRPEVKDGDNEMHPSILTLMKHCWAEDQSQRPSFDEVGKTLRNINKGKSVELCQVNVLLYKMVRPAVADLTQKANSATYDEAPLSNAHAPPPKKKPLHD